MAERSRCRADDTTAVGADYLAAVKAKIKPFWDERALPGPQPVVAFDIARDGDVSNAIIETSSGDHRYDTLAIGSIVRAAPFSPLPHDFKGDFVRVHVCFDYSANVFILRLEPAIERARTERFKEAARELLEKPYYQTPPACGDDGFVDVKNWIVDVTPWAEAAGLQRGDRLLAFDAISLADYDSASEAWSKLPKTDHVTVHVDRRGKEVTVKLRCRGDSRTWNAVVKGTRAIADGQWQACVDALGDYAKAKRITPASVLLLGVQCMRERAKATVEPVPADYWQIVHAYATKAIEESHYRPASFAEIRSVVLTAAEALDTAGHKTLGDDIRRQVETFETTRAGQ